ncbi:MAG TPA: phage scaffolding protein [Clostridia bacterium]|nr:phage scaffolding protein [Clostridia bacterium]
MGLEWLKDVLGEAYNEDVDKKISEEIGKGFVARSDFNALNETKKQLDGQIKDRDKQLNDLKKIDAESLQAEITRLQEENVKAQSDYDEKLK